MERIFINLSGCQHFKNFIIIKENLIDSLVSGTATSAVKAPRSEGQASKNLKQSNEKLYDLVDLGDIFKVTKRTLFNWRAKNQLPLFEVGGKLYMSHQKLVEFIAVKEGRLS